MVRPAAAAKEIQLELALEPDIGPVAGDASRLQQVVWNLLSNAIKFTPKGGRVRVALERGPTHVEISVADSGIGIRSDFLNSVFERFRQGDASTTRKHGGLGLGLSIVKQLVEVHGGIVRAISPGEGLGATFTVSLPLSSEEPVAQPEATRPPSLPPPTFKTFDLTGVSVVVVDDEPDARGLVARVLQECGANVSAAPCAEDALALIESDKPDVLVSDIGMPDVDGFELLRRLRRLPAARGGQLPVIALTAFARDEDRARALEAGFSTHLTKPIDLPALVAAVAELSGRAMSNP
jgi:CheY-like chemotaxis protein